MQTTKSIKNIQHIPEDQKIENLRFIETSKQNPTETMQLKPDEKSFKGILKF